jgi:drug/metabolite transporter (DMT)-like permease
MRPLKHQSLTPGAVALTLFLSALWGGNPVAIKIGLLDCPPLRLGWMRFVLGGLVVLAVALARRERLSVTVHERAPLLGLGSLFAAQLALLNLGQDRTSAGHAAVLLSSYPLWTAVLAHFFVPMDRLTATRTGGAVLAYGGVLLVLSGSLRGSGPTSLSGDVLLLCSAFLLGARQIVLSRLSQGIAITKLLLAQAAVGTVSFVAASALVESEATTWSTRLGVALGYQGFVIAGFAFLMQTWLLKNFAPSRVTTIYMTQPLFGVLLSYLVLGEPLGRELYLGALLVAFGSFALQRRAP